MTLENLLPQKLAEWRFDGERRTLTVPASGWTAAATADCADAVGCRLWELSVQPTAPRPAFDLQARAQRIADRVTGLLEPLALVEVDAIRRTAQLRSREPARRGEDMHYYELLLQGDGAATVRRFQASRNGASRREQTTFTLTHEALSKLVGDLAAD